MICSHEIPTINDWGGKCMFSHLQHSTTDNTDSWMFMSPACSGLHESFYCRLIDPEHDIQNSKHHVSPPTLSQHDSLLKVDATAVASCSRKLIDCISFLPPNTPTHTLTHITTWHHDEGYGKQTNATEPHPDWHWLPLMSSMRRDSLTNSSGCNARISTRPRRENVSG